MGPYGLNILRVGISLALFWLLWLMGKSKAGIERKHIFRFALCGFTGVAINQMLFIKGLTMTAVIHASLLMLSTPLLITLFAFWILKEKMSWQKALGIALGIGGAAFLVLQKEKTGTASWQGDLLILINAISYTVYFILVKPLMLAYKPLHVIRWVFTFGLIMILPFGWIQFSGIEWSSFQFSHFAALGFIVFCGTFLAYSFNIYGIQHLGAGVTGSYIYTQPVFAAVIAMVFLQESFTWQKIISAVLIFGGVFLVSFKKNG